MGLYMKRYQENTKLQNVCRFIADMAVVIIAAYAVVSFTCNKCVVMGSSMNPQLSSDDSVLVNKWAYTVFSAKRYDVIAFSNSQDASGTVYVKRVIGLPGEMVQIKDKRVYIDGELLEDDVITTEILTAGLASTQIQLNKGEYFVLGDNRNNSEDSRFAGIGIVDESEIIGEVWLITSPAHKIGFIK